MGLGLVRRMGKRKFWLLIQAPKSNGNIYAVIRDLNIIAALNAAQKSG